MNDIDANLPKHVTFQTTPDHYWVWISYRQRTVLYLYRLVIQTEFPQVRL